MKLKLEINPVLYVQLYMFNIKIVSSQSLQISWEDALMRVLHVCLIAHV